MKAAFTGGISVSLAGYTTTYAFDSTAGSVGSAYSIQVDGEQVLIGFEDMAGQAGCDYDYNDREWALMVRQTGVETVVDTGSYTLTDTTYNLGTVQVSLTVTKDKPGYEGRYHWKYHVTNSDFQEAPNGDGGAGAFVLEVPESAEIADIYSSLGWYGQVSPVFSNTAVHWLKSETDPMLLPGQSADFSFTTPICAISTGLASIWDDGYGGGAGGGMKMPDLMIRSVMWQRYNDAGTLGENKGIDGPPMPGGGKRIFADRLKPTDSAADSGDQVYVRVELSHILHLTEDKEVTGYLFDVDDPSSADDRLDDEKKNKDNRAATPNFGGNSVPIPKGLRAGKLKIKVSTQPGDNFRFAATVDPTVFLGIDVRIKEQGPETATTYTDGNKADIYFGEGRGASVPLADNKTVKSELLTVWRRLHVERDHMGPPPANHPFDSNDCPYEGNLPNAGIQLLRSNMREAYIETFDDLQSYNATSTIAFVNNLPTQTDYQGVCKIASDARDILSKPDFWAVQIVTSYEGETSVDFDFPNDNTPNPARTESALTGLTQPPRAFDQGAVFVFTEVIRDLSDTFNVVYPNKPAVTLLSDHTNRLVLHEVLHRFGLSHETVLSIPPEPGDEGVMSASVVLDKSKLEECQLTVRQLAIVRSVTKP